MNASQTGGQSEDLRTCALSSCTSVSSRATKRGTASLNVTERDESVHTLVGRKELATHPSQTQPSGSPRSTHDEHGIERLQRSFFFLHGVQDAGTRFLGACDDPFFLDGADDEDAILGGGGSSSGPPSSHPSDEPTMPAGTCVRAEGYDPSSAGRCGGARANMDCGRRSVRDVARVVRAE